MCHPRHPHVQVCVRCLFWQIIRRDSFAHPSLCESCTFLALNMINRCSQVLSVGNQRPAARWVIVSGASGGFWWMTALIKSPWLRTEVYGKAAWRVKKEKDAVKSRSRSPPWSLSCNLYSVRYHLHWWTLGVLLNRRPSLTSFCTQTSH